MITLYSLTFVWLNVTSCPVQPVYQCVIINGPTLATPYANLAEPGGMSSKVAAWILCHMLIDMAFILT